MWGKIQICNIQIVTSSSGKQFPNEHISDLSPLTSEQVSLLTVDHSLGMELCCYLTDVARPMTWWHTDTDHNNVLTSHCRPQTPRQTEPKIRLLWFGLCLHTVVVWVRTHQLYSPYTLMCLCSNRSFFFFFDNSRLCIFVSYSGLLLFGKSY